MGDPAVRQAAGRLGLPVAAAVVLCAAVILLCAGSLFQGAFLPPAKSVVAVAGPCLGLAWVASVLAVRRPAGRAVTTAEWLFLALACLGALSAAWSAHPIDALRAAGILFGGLFFLDLGARAPRWSGRPPVAALVALSAFGAVISVLSLVFVFSGSHTYTWYVHRVYQAAGPFGYPNALAGFLVLTLACGLAAYVAGGRHDLAAGTGWFERLFGRQRAVVLVVTVVPQLAALVLTYSRAIVAVVWLLVILVLVLQASATRRPARSRWTSRPTLLIAALVVFAAGVAALVLIVFPNVASVGIYQSVRRADLTRLYTWQAGIQAAFHRPFAGYGLEGFFDAYLPFTKGDRTRYAHDLLVQQVVELGASGLALTLAFFGALLARAGGILRRGLVHWQVPLALGVTAFALHNLVDLTWYFPPILMLFMFQAGLVLYSEEVGPPGR